MKFVGLKIFIFMIAIIFGSKSIHANEAVEGNSTEIQKNLESWLPPKSTDLTYKKEISKDKNLITTNYIISKDGKTLETWIYTSSSEKNASLVAVISHQMN
ncbi:hypothetical protein [Acinetobacter sp. GN11]